MPAFLVAIIIILPTKTIATYRFSNFKAKPPIHIAATTNNSSPQGMTPSQIKTIYGLPSTGGNGTIAIIGAYDDKTIAADLAKFSTQFNLPACTTTNGCFTQHLMSTGTSTNSGWAMETALDVEWAHAIAPKAKILLVEAKTESGANLLSAIDYANEQSGVVAISMSWGGAEFSDETTLDSHFINKNGAVFFASSGDNGAGASWPAASPNVVGVGGTSIVLNSNGSLSKETAWSGSGGGISAYESQPTFQKLFSIPKSNNMRAIPDVSYDADPASGFPIYDGTKWYEVGGTSAGAPQWAAIQSLGLTTKLANLYKDKSSNSTKSFFRDITSGSNGACTYYCDARTHYDYVTGLGSPLTDKF